MAAHIRYRRDQRRGATLILICLLMVALVAMVAFAVDVGRMFLVRSQLQTAVDAGALAATLQLKEDSEDLQAAMDAANDFVQLNRVGFLVTVPDDAITSEVGTWDTETRTFSKGGDSPDAVHVFANAMNEPLFFARVLGHTKFATPRDAIASGGGSDVDVIMTLDLSGSMKDEGRIEALQDAAPEFVKVVLQVGDNDRIGVMGYGALLDVYNPVAKGHTGTMYAAAPVNLLPGGEQWVAVLEAPLTYDLNFLINNALSSSTLTADKYNSWTPTGAAIRDSAHYLEANARDGVEKIIVLMSDGHANKPNGDGPGYALEMAAYAAGLNIKVYTISLGNDADEDLMNKIAIATGAKHYDATGSSGSLADELTSAFKGVANEIKRTQLVK